MADAHPDTFDFREPYMFVCSVGTIDCRDIANMAFLAPVFPDKIDVVNTAARAAEADFKRMGKRENPYSQIFSPLKWTAWNCGYWFVMKHLYGKVRAHAASQGHTL